MVYDCFLFNNEFEILDIRLHELYDVVDKFVIVESSVSHVNRPKPLHFLKHKPKFKKFQDKIIHVIVDDSPDVILPWIINDYQFSQIARGLKKCKPSDIILLSDADEIPKAEKIIEWKDKKGKLKVFEQTLSYYYLNCIEYTKGPWLGTHMTTYKYLQELGSCWIAKYTKPDITIPDGGWHFSFIGGSKRIQEKVTIQTHQEYNNERFNTPEKILQAIIRRKDLFDHGYQFKIEDTDFLPEHVKSHQEKFKDLIFHKSITKSSLEYLFLPMLELRHRLRVFVRSLRKR